MPICQVICGQLILVLMQQGTMWIPAKGSGVLLIVKAPSHHFDFAGYRRHTANWPSGSFQDFQDLLAPHTP